MLNFIILLLLILLNGIFAMSEIAVISASEGKLEEDAEDGNINAKNALELHQDPNRFLSTVQVGITLVGVTSGAFGGQTLARDIAALIEQNIPMLAQFADQLGTVIIVGITTYLTLVIGELVPKRIAMYNPEGMSKLIATPMNWLSSAAKPLVWLLSTSTSFVARIMGVGESAGDSVSDYEVISMMRRGIDSGEFEEDEHRMVKGALELDDKLIRNILTPRTEIVWLEVNDSSEDIRHTIAQSTFDAYPVCRDSMDEVIGVVRAKDLLRSLLKDDPIELNDMLIEPIYIPETVRASELVKRFRQTPHNVALVVDEYGGLEGIVTLTDLVEEVFGDVDVEEPRARQRDDGSWLLDAQISTSYLEGMLPDLNIPEGERADYATLGGFIMTRLGRIPDEGDTVDWHGYYFEVIDMDDKRVDKILIESHDDARAIVPPHKVDIPDRESGTATDTATETDDDD